MELFPWVSLPWHASPTTTAATTPTSPSKSNPATYPNTCSKAPGTENSPSKNPDRNPPHFLSFRQKYLERTTSSTISRITVSASSPTKKTSPKTPKKEKTGSSVSKKDLTTSTSRASRSNWTLSSVPPRTQTSPCWKHGKHG